MGALANLARMSTATTGTGTITLGSALSGYLTFALAGITNGQTVSYGIADGANSEVGDGVYSSAGPTLTRVVSTSTNANSAISLSGSAQVYITPKASDIFTNIVIQKFTASGTYTPSRGMIYCIIECVGGGGGGGGSATTAAGTQNGSGGGGGGGTSKHLATAADIGASKAVTIGAGGTAGPAGNNSGGAGGDTSVGVLCIGKGASGGTGAASYANGFGGAGGVAGTGNILAVPGGAGIQGFQNNFGSSAFPLVAGGGGNSLYGAGANSISVGQVGVAGTGFGAGGSGSGDYSAASLARAGGSGTAGVVIITEYCSQ